MVSKRKYQMAPHLSQCKWCTVACSGVYIRPHITVNYGLPRWGKSQSSLPRNQLIPNIKRNSIWTLTIQPDKKLEDGQFRKGLHLCHLFWCVLTAPLIVSRRMSDLKQFYLCLHLGVFKQVAPTSSATISTNKDNSRPTNKLKCLHLSKWHRDI